jgi:hypothetical protein
MYVFSENKPLKGSQDVENVSSSITITESESQNDERGLLLRGIIEESVDSEILK